MEAYLMPTLGANTVTFTQKTKPIPRPISHDLHHSTRFPDWLPRWRGFSHGWGEKQGLGVPACGRRVLRGFRPCGTGYAATSPADARRVNGADGPGREQSMNTNAIKRYICELQYTEHTEVKTDTVVYAHSMEDADFISRRQFLDKRRDKPTITKVIIREFSE
jgi:hypothetical protein